MDIMADQFGHNDPSDCCGDICENPLCLANCEVVGGHWVVLQPGLFSLSLHKPGFSPDPIQSQVVAGFQIPFLRPPIHS